MARKPLTDEQKARKRMQDKARIERNMAFILENYSGNRLEFDGKSYTLRQLARRKRSFIEEVVYSQETEVYRLSSYLCVAWANYADTFDFYSFLKTCERIPLDNLLDYIYHRYKDAKRNPLGGSGDMKGFYMVDEVSSKSAGVKWFKVSESKGYTYGISLKDGGSRVYNTSEHEVIRLCLSNEFTPKGLATLIYTVMSATKNLDAKNFYEEIYMWLTRENQGLRGRLFPYE